MKRRFLLVLAAAALLSSCGYVGDPLPPALNLAATIRDLRVTEYGDRLLIEFTIPQLTTDNLPLKKFRDVDLRIGPGATPFQMESWEAAAKPLAVKASAPGAVQLTVPVTDWVGHEAVLAVRIVNMKGKKSTWSNLAVFTAVTPIPTPANFKAESDPAGVKLTWSSAAPKFRVFRQAGNDKQPSLLDSPPNAPFVDKTAEYGKQYSYRVQALGEHAESEVSDQVTITPKDTFPPVPPAGLVAVAGNGTIELVWDRNTEPDLKGYRVYRAVDNGPFERVAELIDTPAYSDRQVESGKKYRYAVTAVDQSNNESERSLATP